MANIYGTQEEYIKAYEKLQEQKINVSALISFAEINYDKKEELVVYKNDPKYRPNNYNYRIDNIFHQLISTFYKINTTDNTYDTYKKLYKVSYLDNTDDDTNDYKDETMLKLNKIFSFVCDNSDKDFTGIELLTAIRKEATGTEENLRGDYYDTLFNMLKKQSDAIRKETDFDAKMKYLPDFFYDVADMENHLFRKKLFVDDYRKSVTGLINYLLLRAQLPLIYIKPIELDKYYESVIKVNEMFDSDEIITFYKEKMCDSINEDLIKPMKKISMGHINSEIKKLTLGIDDDFPEIRTE